MQPTGTQAQAPKHPSTQAPRIGTQEEPKHPGTQAAKRRQFHQYVIAFPEDLELTTTLERSFTIMDLYFRNARGG